MRPDRALAVAVGGIIAYTITVGAMSTKPTARAISADRPVVMYVTFAESGFTMRIAEPDHLDAIGQWLDDAMTSPRPILDLRLLPPPVNELGVEFASGERTTVDFSDRGEDESAEESAEEGRHARPVYVVQLDGAVYTVDWMPEVLKGFLQLARPSAVDYGQAYQARPQRE